MALKSGLIAEDGGGDRGVTVRKKKACGVSLYPAMDTGAPVAVGRSPRSTSITHW